MALHALKQSGNFEVAALLTSLNEEHDRISMHGVRRILLERQAEALGLPLHLVPLPNPATNAVYEARMAVALEGYRNTSIARVAFGDIFLEDLRAYRERNLARIGMRGIFPIWKRDTRELARTFLSLGFRAVVTCVDTKVLDASFAGRAIDSAFLDALPPTVDTCGENGEFHSFVFDGPLFRAPVRFVKGEAVIRDTFCFCDLCPE